METKFIILTKENIEKEHICCAFSDKKCAESYEMKKNWLKKEVDNGFVFRRLDERAKVFIEYVPAEKGWIPVNAPDYLLINCMWVSGQYKGKGEKRNRSNLFALIRHLYRFDKISCAECCSFAKQTSSSGFTTAMTCIIKKGIYAKNGW